MSQEFSTATPLPCPVRDVPRILHGDPTALSTKDSPSLSLSLLAFFLSICKSSAMQEPELHDLSDDADYTASQQHGSASMMRSDSGKHSLSSEHDGAEVVFLKDNVNIHPAQSLSERISGRLRLIKHGSSLFMTWIPYKGLNSIVMVSEKDRNLYTIRSVPLTEVRSIRRHTPMLGWPYIIVVLATGLAFPPLYFYNGGVKEFLDTIKQHVFLVRSAEDANVFMVNDFQNPLQRTLSSLELPRALSVASGQSTLVSVGETSSDENQERTSGYENTEIYELRHKKKAASEEWTFLYIILCLEILSVAFDQASSPRKPHYALFGMLLAIVGVLISALEFIYKGIKGRVVLRRWGKLWWFYYPPPPCYKPLGTVIEIYGLVGGIAQCVSSIIQYVYFSQHLDSPFKVSLLPAILVICLITSRLSKDRMRIRDGAGGRSL